jgi:hypothetical protein
MGFWFRDVAAGAAFLMFVGSAFVLADAANAFFVS